MSQLIEKLKCEPTMFFDLSNGRESEQSKSKQNVDEAEFICQLIQAIANTVNAKLLKGRIGIITPYRQQKNLIKRVLFDNKKFLGGLVPADGVHGIEINTVDAYQGREKDIIIVSTVRTDGIGFLQDYRRMNVAITRAKSFMWIVGNQKNL